MERWPRSHREVILLMDQWIIKHCILYRCDSMKIHSVFTFLWGTQNIDTTWLQQRKFLLIENGKRQIHILPPHWEEIEERKKWLLLWAITFRPSIGLNWGFYQFHHFFIMAPNIILDTALTQPFFLCFTFTMAIHPFYTLKLFLII